MANLVQYGAYTEEMVKKETADWMSKASLKYEVGDNIVRVLAPPPGKSPFRVVWTHFVRIPGQEKPLVFACPLKEKNATCPICQHADKLKFSGNPADFDLAKEFFAKRRVYANVIDRRNEAAGPVIMGFGKEIHDQIRALRSNPDYGGDFTNPETGFDINIVRTGTGKNDTSYKVWPKKPSPLGNMDWIGMQHDLEAQAVVKTADQIREELAAHRPGARPQNMNAARSLPAAQQMAPEQSQARQPRPQTVVDMPSATQPPPAGGQGDDYPF